MTDSLAVLARLRNAEVAAARRRVAEEAARREAAEMAARSADEALVAEARHGTGYVAWLPRGLALRAAAEDEARRAQERAAEAILSLAAARASERAVESLSEMRAAEARRRARRDEQRRLDEAGARRPSQPQG
ncbi:hypothetical protein EAH89_22850 [Roseomonas nepalensis]|uniref:Flagellar export protein FliJ n=1 Tax=Muricoccus nepalensis TaxID=1854500 RepID=A0A502FGS5_9PROT|nr:hypothetical protein [Roseomonas nepalensis]TPG48423.1 hypothetical protein EAH89_22850 [Roseomonas nepalensis]